MELDWGLLREVFGVSLLSFRLVGPRLFGAMAFHRCRTFSGGAVDSTGRKRGSKTLGSPFSVIFRETLSLFVFVFYSVKDHRTSC